jgi:hypothetical protein
MLLTSTLMARSSLLPMNILSGCQAGAGYPAKDLQIGMLFQTDRETFVNLDRIEQREGTFKVYNLRLKIFIPTLSQISVF